MLELLAPPHRLRCASAGYLDSSLLDSGVLAIQCQERGDALFGAGQLRAAALAYEEALRLRPDFPQACSNLGAVLHHLGEDVRAESFLRRALKLMPVAAVHNNLGSALAGQGKPAEAVKAFQRAGRLEPSNPQIAYNLGAAWHEIGDLVQAVAWYREALRLRPDYLDALNNLAVALKEEGSVHEAEKLLRQILRLNPDHVLAYFNVSELMEAGFTSFLPHEVERMEALATSESIPPLRRSICGFALAKHLDQQGAYDAAFAHFERANFLRGQVQVDRQLAFDARAHATCIGRIIATFTPAYFEHVRGWGSDSALPVFIVGMPRSGSTLVEQILASHPQILGGGEIGPVHALTLRHGAAENDFCFTVRGKRAAEDLAGEYLETIDPAHCGCARATVKTLDNFLHLGLIATLFPRARIIHCRRDPLDVCLSCYFQNFHGVNFAWSLEDIGSYHRAYEKLMAHWSEVLPMHIHEVRYEELVHNQEAVSRSLLRACGLEWDERCLTFYKTKRAVRSASSVQVRQPVSTRSIGRWRRYQNHIQPLLRTLASRHRPVV